MICKWVGHNQINGPVYAGERFLQYIMDSMNIRPFGEFGKHLLSDALGQGLRCCEIVAPLF